MRQLFCEVSDELVGWRRSSEWKGIHDYRLFLLLFRFTLYERKHHCRNCGQVFCNKCSRFESEISRLKILKPVRVCQPCYGALKQHSTE